MTEKRNGADIGSTSSDRKATPTDAIGPSPGKGPRKEKRSMTEWGERLSADLGLPPASDDVRKMIELVNREQRDRAVARSPYKPDGTRRKTMTEFCVALDAALGLPPSKLGQSMLKAQRMQFPPTPDETEPHEK